jgi:23S rRNA (adenine2503-C2)-methyltransferase
MKPAPSRSEPTARIQPPGKVDLRNLTLEEMKALTAEWGLEAYRGEQVYRWIFKPGIEGFQQMTNIAKGWRDRLSELAYLSRLEIRAQETSRDGTRKFLFGLEDGERIESVLIPERGHYTLCISSQVGCGQGCRFCYTGRIGFRRDLKAAEIVNQVLAVKGLLTGTDLPLTNVVLMGMGEPLANLDHTLKALDILLSPQGLQLSHRHLTLSTAGLIPAMDRLGRVSPVNLAVSLNAADNATRDRLMPVNRRYPLPDLLEACRRYPLPHGKRITFEYILIQGINDSPAAARELSDRLRGIKAKINLIPFNPHPGIDFRPPSEKTLAAFQEILIQRHYTVIIRRSKGSDISAACGQLHAQWTGVGRSPVAAVDKLTPNEPPIR